MELDDLKNIWKNNDGFKAKNEAEIASMLKGRSKSIINKLKRSAWFEMIFTLVSGVILLIYALTSPTLKAGAYKWTTISILILFGAYSYYYVKKLSLLNRFDFGKENIKANLETLAANLTGYLKFYKRSYTILYPVYFVLTLVFVAIEQGMEDFFANLMRTEVIVSLLLLAFVVYFCSTWLVDWLFKKLYGNHLEKLKRLLQELDSSTTFSLT